MDNDIIFTGDLPRIVERWDLRRKAAGVAERQHPHNVVVRRHRLKWGQAVPLMTKTGAHPQACGSHGHMSRLIPS